MGLLFFLVSIVSVFLALVLRVLLCMLPGLLLVLPLFFAISMASLSVTGCRGAMNVAGMSVSGYWFGLRNCLCCLMLMGCVSMNSGRFIFCFFFLLFGGVWGVGSIGLPSVGSLSCHSNV